MQYYVQCVPQETTNTCWAAAMATLLQYLSGNSRPPASQPTSPFMPRFTPRYVAEQVGGIHLMAYIQNRMLSSDIRDNFTRLADRWDLFVDFEFDRPSPSGWESLLRQFGPVFVNVYLEFNDHTVVVSGVHEGRLTIVDPWPVGSGSRYHRSISDIPSPVSTIIHRKRETQVLAPSRGGGY